MLYFKNIPQTGCSVTPFVFTIFSVNVSSKFSSSSANSLRTSNKIVTVREKIHTIPSAIATGLLSNEAALEASLEPDVCVELFRVIKNNTFIQNHQHYLLNLLPTRPFKDAFPLTNVHILDLIDLF